jgi:hypothetical protein
MLPYTIQWYRNFFLKEVKILPTIRDEHSYLKYGLQRCKKAVPNPHHYPFFCFPCGQYHKEIKEHDGLKKHIRNAKRWKKEMGYL